MQIKLLDERLLYDGSQIRPLWAFDMGFERDSIIVWRGPMDVRDIKDAEDERAHLEIKGADLIHLVVERFSTHPSMHSAYLMQRLLAIHTQGILRDMGIDVTRDGDDLYARGGKLTVSIATAGGTSEKIHLGINLQARGIPDDVNATGLADFGISPGEWKDIAEEIATSFHEELMSIENDMRKTRPI